MRVFWWQGGLHAQPESEEDRAALVGLFGILDRIQVGHEVDGDPVGQGRDKQPVVPAE